MTLDHITYSFSVDLFHKVTLLWMVTGGVMEGTGFQDSLSKDFRLRQW